MKYRLSCFIVLLLFPLTSYSQRLLTRPERSNYEETSRYDDVMQFVNAVAANSKTMKLTWLGYSTEGRHLPMVVYGDVANTKPETIRRSGKLVVYLQGNIHAGEVEGKEALLELLRELKEGKHASWRKNLILLIVPIFNADGNEKVSLYNRGVQNGPIAGMGQRANAQNLDLNRDHTKVESPEVYSFIQMMKDYDPAVLMDLHTTNGSFHGYHLTYAVPNNPNLDAALDHYTREKFIPAVINKMTAQKWRTHYYGDYIPKTPRREPGFYTYGQEPRYNTNYTGFRNRISVLSEAYSYITYKERIAVSRAFVTSVVDYSSEHAKEIRTAVTQADEHAKQLGTGAVDSLGVQFQIRQSSPSSPILFAPVREEKNPYTGAKMYRMNEDSLHTEMVPEYQLFSATRKAKVPTAYAVPDTLIQVIQLLEAHGIAMEQLTTAKHVRGEQFKITESRQQPNPFQGHSMRRLEGIFEPVERDLPAGTYIVPMSQSLSLLAFSLLEPESDDGVVTWNFLDKALANTIYYPIFKY